LELKNALPNWDELDIEVTKSFDKLSDIFLAHVNKRIQIVNLLSDDIDEWVRLRMKGKVSWEMVRKGYAEGYPKIDKRRLMTKFSGNACNFWLWTYVQKRSRNTYGLAIEVSPFINWCVGQWDVYGKNSDEVMFQLRDYEDIKTKLEKKDEAPEIEIVYTGTQYENVESRNDKFIGLYVDATTIDSQDKVIRYHTLFKEEVLEPIFKKIRSI
jgi:hypothetical protein